ncbi:MAG: phosphoribosylanthranilate isomerase [Acidimicrobiia bacterium]|nr:phosphoribosylanthranilate isomerase [Acidimicrobiia bacterium]
MTWVKVCGLTRRDDVEAAVDSGADAVGFVLAPDSPRRVDLDMARDLGRGIPAVRVLVVVDASAEEALEAIKVTGAEAVQLHGEGALAAARTVLAAGAMVLLASPPGAQLGPAVPGQIPIIDNRKAGMHGGTGEAFDWSLAEGITQRFVLAGGLGPDNVVEAIMRTRPWGVDASSRLESAPGVKDHGMVHRFVQEAKRA